MAVIPDGEPEFRRPDGSRIPQHPRAPCVEGRTRLRCRGVSAGTLSAGSNQPYDKALAVEALLGMAPPG